MRTATPGSEMPLVHTSVTGGNLGRGTRTALADGAGGRRRSGVEARRWIGAAEPGGEVPGIEGVAGADGVHHGGGCRRRRLGAGAVRPGGAGRTELHHDL